MSTLSLGDRMKAYENVYRHYLDANSHIIIRIDGRAFHTYTRGLEKPFDKALLHDMHDTAKRLAQQIDGCVASYVQSDEISLLIPFRHAEATPWFGGNLQKIVSVSASMASGIFNINRILSHRMFQTDSGADMAVINVAENLAEFDARVMTVPVTSSYEVINYFIWRQRDAFRNAVQAIAQSHFTQKQLHGKNLSAQIEMISEKGDSIDNYDFLKGLFYYKTLKSIENPLQETIIRPEWKSSKEDLSVKESDVFGYFSEILGIEHE